MHLYFSAINCFEMQFGVINCFEMHVFKLSDFNGVQNWNMSEGEKSSLQILATRNTWDFMFL